MTELKQIGLFHSLTQLVVFGIYSGGIIFLLPLALAETPGWVMLGLWISLNFLAIPVIIAAFDKVTKVPFISVGVNICLTSILGALVGFGLYVTYYKFHMYYIDSEFELAKYQADFVPIVTITALTILSTEIVRQVYNAHTHNTSYVK